MPVKYPNNNSAMIFRAIGLMSGTSLDGLDICFAEFKKNNHNWSFDVVKAETIPYSKNWENRLRNSIYLSAEDLLALHSEYGFYLGKAVKEFIDRHSLQNIDLISSHGHTVFHQPEKKFTLQIGDGRAIKITTQIPVVYDFRSQDVLMGGNGAPLVPIGDELLFSDYDACINIGGFSNISLQLNNSRIAFDIAPVNIILNRLAQEFNQDYDFNGDLAKKGEIHDDLLKKLNALPFYRQSPPKSLGIEWCNENIFPLFKGIRSLDVLSTYTEHAAVQISSVLQNYNLKSVLFTGGGTHNQFLIEKIREKINSQIIVPGRELIDFKESLIFALMGILKLNNEINVFASTTGSSSDHSSGLII